MKARLEFKLPQEREEYDLHMRAPNYYCALTDLKNYLRSLRKYETPKGMHSRTIEAIEKKFLKS